MPLEKRPETIVQFRNARFRGPAPRAQQEEADATDRSVVIAAQHVHQALQLGVYPGAALMRSRWSSASRSRVGTENSGRSVI
jgi:hypothetical protein